MPWLAYGDYGEVLCNSEKFGGSPVSLQKSLRFSEMINRCCFSDMGFSGLRFMWTNLRYSRALIQERLDQVLANNNSWWQLFPNAEVVHLPRIHSDHCPVFLICNPDCNRLEGRPFKLETMCLSHLSFEKLILEVWYENEIELCPSYTFAGKARVWNMNILGM